MVLQHWHMIGGSHFVIQNWNSEFVADAKKHRGARVGSERMNQIRPILAEKSAALAIMKPRHKPKYDLPNLTQAFRRAFHHEQKEEKTGEQISQDTQKSKKQRVSDDDRAGYAAPFQSREILIVLIRLI